jgi:hypothetical protein
MCQPFEKFEKMMTVDKAIQGFPWRKFGGALLDSVWALLDLDLTWERFGSTAPFDARGLKRRERPEGGERATKPERASVTARPAAALRRGSRQSS